MAGILLLKELTIFLSQERASFNIANFGTLHLHPSYVHKAKPCERQTKAYLDKLKTLCNYANY
jgi:hypothetical protein